MKKALIVLSLLSSALVVTACSNILPTDSASDTVTGQVFYRERIALPQDAVVSVTLADTSKMDAPAEVISTHSYATAGKSVPFDFSLPYSASKIQSNHTYTVSARIEANGKLLFTSTTSNPVITNPEHTTKLNIMLMKVDSSN